MSSAFQKNRIRNTKKRHHALVPKHHFGPGSDKYLTVLHWLGESILRVLYHFFYILQQQFKKYIILISKVMIQINPRKA